MSQGSRRLSALVAAAIDHQLPDAPESDLPADRFAQRQTADQLVAEALNAGRIDGVQVAELEQFSAGHTAMMVARVSTTLSFVVKVDRSPDLVAEAHLLRRLGSDPALPAATRQAFPRIYAIDDEGPIYGYLMEDLTGFTPLSEGLSRGSARTRRRILDAWSALLEPAYRATRSTRLAPNVREDYFRRARTRLDGAAAQGLLPSPTRPISLISEEQSADLATGWGPALDSAERMLDEVAPPFSTFVHGDPNPENILWRDSDDGGVEFRLIDPKVWGAGDYLFDAAKLAHYVMVTAPMSRAGAPPPTLTDEGDRVHLTYRRDHLDLDDTWFVVELASLAGDPIMPDTPAWRMRYRLAVAANLLGIAGPRLQRGEVALGLTAFAEGLRILTDLASGVEHT